MLQFPFSSQNIGNTPHKIRHAEHSQETSLHSVAGARRGGGVGQKPVRRDSDVTWAPLAGKSGRGYAHGAHQPPLLHTAEREAVGSMRPQPTEQI